MATERDLLTARLFMRAVFPVMKVLLNDDPAMKKRFENVSAKVQFTAKNGADILGAYLVFDNGEFRVEQGLCENPDITFSFSTVEKMNAMLAGKPVLPGIKGIRNLGLLMKVMSLLLGLKLMMPSARPKDYARKKLKVKLAFYMVTTALSQYNKGGDPDMVKWTAKQPDRIYQMSVEGEDDVSAYLRVKGGKTKAGRGFYLRRRPFVHMRFHSIDGALAVLLRDAEFVDGVGKGFVTIDGAPEYGAQINDFMQRIQALLT
ncbi:MAG TPA: hypothetical protein PK573_14585 [Spirochaetota bacterium]|nr:hypothetical protein [Spirochaetota bacterium]HRZ26459.1 hypothetical protein [Spirochaetota bacterium]